MQNLPAEFIHRLEKIYSKEDLDIVKSWFQTNRPLSIRVNTLKTNNENIEKELNKLNINFEKISFLENWYILLNIEKKDIWKTEIYKNWEIYLQNISSQIPALVLWVKEGENILDLTAAPWSKTTQISALMNNTWSILACEKNAIRMDKMKYNIKKLGCKNIETYKWDVRNLAKYLKENKKDILFDRIIADLPCSAEW